jgi:hypothetical protein
MTIPRMAVAVPIPDDQMTNLLHDSGCLRNGVKYNQ